jgi:hypothetical protein
MKIEGARPIVLIDLNISFSFLTRMAKKNAKTSLQWIIFNATCYFYFYFLFKIDVTLKIIIESKYNSG